MSGPGSCWARLEINGGSAGPWESSALCVLLVGACVTLSFLPPPHTHAHTLAHTHIQTYTHTHTYKHTHTHVHSVWGVNVVWGRCVCVCVCVSVCECV